jgi:hypothetical protein
MALSARHGRGNDVFSHISGVEGGLRAKVFSNQYYVLKRKPGTLPGFLLFDFLRHATRELDGRLSTWQGKLVGLSPPCSDKVAAPWSLR